MRRLVLLALGLGALLMAAASFYPFGQDSRAGRIGDAIDAIDGFGGDSSPEIPGNAFESNQQGYAEQLGEARDQLFGGHLSYTDTKTLGLVAGEPVWFRAEVRGSWHSVRPGELGADVRVGAEIGLRLHCSGAGVTCTPVLSEVKSVLARGDNETWLWRVTAKRSGKVDLALTVTAYYRDTDTVLFEKPIMSHATAAPAPDDSGPFPWVVSVLTWAKSVVLELGLLAGALAAVWGLCIAVRNRRDSAGAEGALPSGTSGETALSPQAEAEVHALLRAAQVRALYRRE